MNFKTFGKFLGLVVILVYIASASHAGIRGAGKYSGVVVFDRWGGCTLYSSIYVMYISEEVKKELLPFRDKAIQINATDVFQPENPGDGLIKKFEYVGAAPANPSWINTEGLKLKTFSDFQDGNTPSVVIEVANTSEKQLKIRSEDLAPTLLAKKISKSEILIPSDGPSFALVTREGFWIGGGDGPRWHGNGGENGQPYLWTIGESHALPEYFTLEPREKRQIKIDFGLPEGEYDFLCGYGGGVHESQCIASNRTAFDVTKDGKGKMVKVP